MPCSCFDTFASILDGLHATLLQLHADFPGNRGRFSFFVAAIGVSLPFDILDLYSIAGRDSAGGERNACRNVYIVGAQWSLISLNGFVS